MSWINPSSKRRPTKLLHTRATCRELWSACTGWRNPITKFISLLLRIDGRYVMLSRQVDENLYLTFSDDPHFWSDPLFLQEPLQPWEFVKLGNCGSPIEAEAGWLVLTHGVGPMRKYCIGAILLDLDNPARIIGQLKEPLLRPEANEREGYVPNVVYSCGSLVHNGQLILPYGISDTASSIVRIELSDLLAALT